MYDAVNLGRRIDVLWPDERMRQQGGRTFWQDWIPQTGMEGQVSLHSLFPKQKSFWMSKPLCNTNVLFSTFLSGCFSRVV